MPVWLATMCRHRRKKPLRETIELLGEKLGALQGRIDLEAVNKEDFAELFKSCYLAIIRSNREEKLHAAAAMLANMLLLPGDPCKSSYEELDHLIRCIDALSIGAISFWAQPSGLPLLPAKALTDISSSINCGGLFKQFDASLLMSLVSELRALNLLRVQEGGSECMTTGKFCWSWHR